MHWDQGELVRRIELLATPASGPSGTSPPATDLQIASVIAGAPA